MNILILGGDQRQVYAERFLKELGYEVKLILDFETFSEIRSHLITADVILLPLPVSRDGVNLNTINKENAISLQEIILNLGESKTVFGGMINSCFRNILNERGIKYIDYNEIESFQINNALLSAEGAIYYASSRYEKSINDSCVLVMGYGRIAKVLAYLLKMHGADVSVLLRSKKDMAWCKAQGLKVINLNKEADELITILKSADYDLVFNTIPHQLFGGRLLYEPLKNSLIMDLASAPFGIDIGLAKEKGLNYYLESSIPGRYAPISAGKIIAKTIANEIIDRGI